MPETRAEKKVNGFFIRGQAVGADQAVHTASEIPLSAQKMRLREPRQTTPGSL